MTLSESDFSSTVDSERTRAIQAALQDVGRRQWWLWSTAVMVTILLTMGIASFAFPGLLDAPQGAFYYIGFEQAVRGLVGLVLIFTVYAVYQQLQIRRIQLALWQQVSTLDKIEARTEEVYKLAMLDSLTGLHNRRCGEQRLANELARAQRNGLPLEVIMLDLDDLKYVNDKFGHGAGDELIKYFAVRLTKAIRGSDLAVRLGGDEFLLVLPECKPDEARYVLGRLAELTIELDGEEVPVTFSAGWADFAPGETADELIKRADEALYINKRSKQQEAPTLVAQ